MVALIIQTILLFAIVFILGCIAGCLLHGFFGRTDKPGEEERSDAVEITAPAGSVRAEPDEPLSPVVPAPPMPVAPVELAESAQVTSAPASFVAKPQEPKPSAKPHTPSKPISGPKALAEDRTPPKSETASRKMMPAAAKPDNLKLIRGIGAQNENRLNGLGINSFAQIAGWTGKDEAYFGEVLAFPGRIEREEWVPQARVLAKGGTTEFSKRVRQGTVKSSTGTAQPEDLGKKPSGLLSGPRGEKGDNLTLIDGVGNALERKLFNTGIYHFDQIAQMSADELKWLGNALGFPGRPERENWAGESKVLAAGGTTEHAQRVERGEIKTSRKSED